MRDEHGVVHDRKFVAEQTGLIMGAPVYAAAAPVAIVARGIEAWGENGRIDVSGDVVDESGQPLNGVTLRVIRSRLVTWDLNDDAAVFWEQVRTRDVNRAFAVDLWNTHSVRLEFSKDGFERCDHYFELMRSDGYAQDAAPATTQPIYATSPLRRQNIRVVMKRAGSTIAAATRPAA
jgi:hypothetical protein